jgi:hypothetical protein
MSHRDHAMRHHNGMEVGRSGHVNPPKAQYEIDLFWYVANFGTLASGASATVAIQIQSDSSFEWSKATFYAVETGASEPVSQSEAVSIGVNIQDTGTGRNLMQLPVPLTTMAGNGQLPFIIPQPRIFKANAVVQITFNNFSVAGKGTGAVSYDYVQFMLVGRKIWKRSKSWDPSDD